MPMLISSAYAQGISGMFDSSNAMVQFLPLVLIFVVFYFLLIRPQQRKQKEHRGMLETLRRGDRVVTGGGILGTVNKVVGDQEVEVDIAQGVRVRVVRSTITSVVAKPDPAAAREAAKEKIKPPRDAIEATARPWRQVLQLHREKNVTAERVDEQYRKLARERHPDSGGSEAMMTELNSARDAAKQELGLGVE
jgi:preprotein translocase subunit YajC